MSDEIGAVLCIIGGLLLLFNIGINDKLAEILAELKEIRKSGK
jgi:hypothetical protein